MSGYTRINTYMKKNCLQNCEFTIVIPTLNEELFLPNLLTDLANQTYQNFKVIVVDAESDDNTIAKAEEFKKQLDLKVIVSKKRNVGHQRNLGGEATDTDWIIFMDADDSLPSYFLQGIKYHLEKEGRIDFFTSLIETRGCPAAYRPYISVMNLSLQVGSYAHPHSYGSLIGVKKEAFNEIKFDPKNGFGEDYIYTRNLDKAGYSFACFKDPTYKFSFRRFDKDGFAKIINSLISGQLQLLTKGSIDRQRNYPMLGGSYYQTNSEKQNRKFLSKARKSLKSILSKYEQSES